MTKLLVSLLFLLPVSGFAQTIDLSINSGTDIGLGADDCGQTVTATWAWKIGAGSQPCTPLVIWATGGDCGDVKKDGDIQLDDEAASNLAMDTSGTFMVKIADLPAFKNAGADGGVTCGAPDIEKEHFICASARLPNLATDPGCATSGNYVRATKAVSLFYDTKAPAAPAIGDITSLDTKIRVAFTVDSDTVVVHVEIKGPQSADFERVTTVAYTAGSATVGNLKNGVTYSIRLVAEDAAGNPSAPSEVKQGSPVQTDGLWDLYKRQGGDEPGGCNIAPASLSLVAGASLLALVLFRRRRVR
jgi:hypothetical protein